MTSRLDEVCKSLLEKRRKNGIIPQHSTTCIIFAKISAIRDEVSDIVNKIKEIDSEMSEAFDGKPVASTVNNEASNHIEAVTEEVKNCIEVHLEAQISKNSLIERQEIGKKVIKSWAMKVISDYLVPL